ncbi:MAG: hypothetical protein JWS10_2215 [Cypionkella sp.]|uniref:radical SAM/SPASM domain-containing protein n=1 Tax=Cypionkella sp. TaxID=2811411 RepID=UPI0026097BA5|nr:radical SAM/SPASM domain-containing protein [Cypionkella sp.]MDB5659600.1 hypothetical protein [Cypionkella sp.]
MYIGREMYAAQTDLVLQRDLFKKSVKRIEVETHSYCNRRCDYCPNVIGDRLGPNVHIQQTIYDRLLSGLAEVDFEHAFVLNSYNEPLYDRAILDRIAEARRALPKARLMIYTNGDYLTPEYVNDLADAGLNYLHVSIHTQRGDVYDDRYVLNRISEIAHRTRLQVKYSSVNPGSIIVAKFATPRLEMETRAINFTKHGNDRGGLLPDLSPEKVRTDPCTFVFSHLHMGFNGNVVPCCHIRSDRPEHAKNVIGNLGRSASIFDIFFSEKAAAWRRGLVHNGPKSGPCATCTAGSGMNDPKWRDKMQSVYQRYVAPQQVASALA